MTMIWTDYRLMLEEPEVNTGGNSKRNTKGRSWLPDPRTFPKFTVDTLSVQDHGFAEIKPHNEDGIRDGLKQLEPSTEKKPALGRAGRRGMALVTYLPVNKEGEAVGEGSAAGVHVFATPYSGQTVDHATHKKRVKDIINSWTWHHVGCFKPPQRINLVVDRAALFGIAIEKSVRRQFNLNVLARLKPKKIGHGGTTVHGADIYWNELARFYAELARELGDPFYADLASELASLGREAALWDAA